MNSTKIFNSLIKYKITVYSTKYLIEVLNNSKIEVENIEKISDYSYIITVKSKYEKKINHLFDDAILIEKKGIIIDILNFIKTKSSAISLIISVLSFSYFNNLIFDIKIIGNSPSYNQLISEKLSENNIQKYKKIPNYSDIIYIENDLIDALVKIENLDINIKGTIVIVEYSLKEEDVKIEESNSKYYASKSGIVKNTYIERGNLLCSTNQYVNKGELLIDDHIIINDKSIYVGGYGKVYAYTWTIVETSVNVDSSNYVDVYTSLLNDIRYQISKDFKDGEYIDSEKHLINSYINNQLHLKIHFTTVENIAKIQ